MALWWSDKSWPSIPSLIALQPNSPVLAGKQVSPHMLAQGPVSLELGLAEELLCGALVRELGVLTQIVAQELRPVPVTDSFT
mgnify:CR=1 FL=1|jgi:hypothetical protein